MPPPHPAAQELRQAGWHGRGDGAKGGAVLPKPPVTRRSPNARPIARPSGNTGERGYFFGEARLGASSGPMPWTQAHRPASERLVPVALADPVAVTTSSV